MSTRDSHHINQFTIYSYFYHWIRIRIQHFKWIRIQSGSNALMTKNWRKKYNWKFFCVLLLTTAIYSSLGLHKGLPSYRRSLQPSKENIQHFKKWNLLTFSIFVGHFCPPGSGSTTVISTVGSETESGFKIPFEWLLPQTPQPSNTTKIIKISEFLADKRLHGTHGSEHIAGVRTQLTPFSLHPRSTSWNRSHFYPNMLFINRRYCSFQNIAGIRYAESRTRF